jgi:hypothetical protein
MTTKTDIRTACEELLNDWNRSDWMSETASGTTTTKSKRGLSTRTSCPTVLRTSKSGQLGKAGTVTRVGVPIA